MHTCTSVDGGTECEVVRFSPNWPKVGQSSDKRQISNKMLAITQQKAIFGLSYI